MKVGSFVFATDQGLGVLAKSFYDHGIVTDVLVIRHGTHPTHEDWYPGAAVIGDLRSAEARRGMEDFCRTVDVMLFFETPFWWPVVDHCRRIGTDTIIMPMHECMPANVPCHPDLWLCPSLLDLQWARGYGLRPEQMTFLPVPVDTKRVPWRLRERAEVFVHNAGHGGLRGRNGTAEFLEALWHCDCLKGATTNARVIIRSQGRIPPDVGPMGDLGGKITWLINRDAEYEDLYAAGDVFVFPEKFNGLSLPLQEARAAGMLVMGTNRFPMNTWLPNDPLIMPTGYVEARIGPPYSLFQEAVLDPRDIAAKIDEWYGKDITEYSRAGREWAEANSWEVLGPKYKAVLEGL